MKTSAQGEILNDVPGTPSYLRLFHRRLQPRAQLRSSLEQTGTPYFQKHYPSRGYWEANTRIAGIPARMPAPLSRPRHRSPRCRLRGPLAPQTVLRLHCRYRRIQHRRGWAVPPLPHRHLICATRPQ
jgi:hypothetical protein